MTALVRDSSAHLRSGELARRAFGCLDFEMCLLAKVRSISSPSCEAVVLTIKFPPALNERASAFLESVDEPVLRAAPGRVGGTSRAAEAEGGPEGLTARAICSVLFAFIGLGTVHEDLERGSEQVNRFLHSNHS